MDSNTSSNIVQLHSIMKTLKTETLGSVDYSEDYSLDWDSFSFESEISARTNIHKSNLQALKLMADYTYEKVIDENIVNDLRKYTDIYSELLSKNKNCSARYEALLREYKDIQRNVAILTARNKTVERTITEFEEEKSTCLKEYQQLKAALEKGLEMYTTHFNINGTTKSLSDTTYEATLRFNENKNVGPVKFVVDRINRKVIDFHANEALLPEEEKDIKKEFGKLDNLPGLLCALREIILKK